MNNEELRQCLEGIQDRLKSQDHNFPKNCCSTAVREVYQELGYLPVGGHVALGGLVAEHSWNVDSNTNTLVDITLYQFNDVYRTPADPIIILPSDEAIMRYGYVEREGRTEALRQGIIQADRSIPTLRG